MRKWLVHTVSGAGGARRGIKMLRVQGREKKNSLTLRSLRSSVVLVTPNFRENHTQEGGEGENNAIFPGNHFFIYDFSKHKTAINALQQTACSPEWRWNTAFFACTASMWKKRVAPKLAWITSSVSRPHRYSLCCAWRSRPAHKQYTLRRKRAQHQRQTYASLLKFV